MPRMFFRIKRDDISANKDFIMSNTYVNVVLNDKRLFNGKVTNMNETDVQLVDSRFEKHHFKVADVTEIVAEKFV